MGNVQEMPELMTVKEVAEILRTGDATVRRYANDGIIPGARRRGFLWRFDRKLLAKWLNDDIESSRGKDEPERALQTGTD